MSTATPIDDSLLELYRAEAEVQTDVLARELAELMTAPDNFKKVLAAQNAAHALNGAARMIGLEKDAQLAHAMEKLLTTASAQKQVLEPARIRGLQCAANWLAKSAQLPTAELANPGTERLAEQAACLAELTTPSVKPTAAPMVQSPMPTAVMPTPEIAPTSNFDFSLLDLYHTEAETQLGALTQGLVELEGDFTNPKKTEPIMRAAHSLKGAARIIGLDLVVKLSHLMEDALVAAQHGNFSLTPAAIDAFLQAADWLAQYSRLTEKELVAPSATLLSAHAACVAKIQAVLTGQPVKVQANAEAAPAETGSPVKKSVTPSPLGVTTASAPATDGAVRVSAASLSRLMGLAAETLVETRRLQPFRDALIKLKNSQMLQVSRLEAAIDRLAGNNDHGLVQVRAAAQTTLEALRAQLEQFDTVARRNTLLSGRLYQEVIASRMRPFRDGAAGFPRLVRDVSRALGKQVRLEIEGRETPVDRDILEKLEAPLNHLLRNACDHGLETPEEREAAGKPEAGVIHLEARHHAGMLVLKVIDDGRGISLARLRKKVVEKGQASTELVASLSDDEVLQFLFLPGFSTAEQVTEISGRGVGLDVVQNLMHEVGGVVRITTAEGQGTTFTLQLPVTRSVLRALLVEVDGEAYAFALSRLSRTLRVDRGSIKNHAGHAQLAMDGANIGLVSARTALGFSEAGCIPGTEVAVVVIGDGINFYGLEVDRLLGETELVVRPLDARLGKVPGVSAAALSEDGEPILIVDVDDLLAVTKKILTDGVGPAVPDKSASSDAAVKRVLVVDDSPTVRETARQILTEAGYAVELAVDGADGWNAVRLGQFDLVVSDVDMPRLNGLELLQRIRADARWSRLPVLFVTYKNREQDRQRGLAAGAEAYLTKKNFDDGSFLRTVQELLSRSKVAS